MKISELADVELNHISLGDRKGNVRIVGKGKKERTVPLPLRTRKALAAYLEVRPDMKTDKLFLGQRSALGRTGIYKIIKKYADRVGLSDKVHPHTLRHQFATTLLREKQVDISLLADMLGHESLETTRVYTRPSYADKEAALEDL